MSGFGIRCTIQLLFQAIYGNFFSFVNVVVQRSRSSDVAAKEGPDSDSDSAWGRYPLIARASRIEQVHRRVVAWRSIGARCLPRSGYASHMFQHAPALRRLIAMVGRHDTTCQRFKSPPVCGDWLQGFCSLCSRSTQRLRGQPLAHNVFFDQHPYNKGRRPRFHCRGFTFLL